jgi:alpha-ketoglutarate-dependent taurine dioxygenase
LALNKALIKTIDLINQSGAKAILVQDVPTLPNPIQDLNDGFTQSIEDVSPQQTFIKNFLSDQKNPMLQTIDLANTLCINQICHTYLNGYYLYNDNNHITHAGAALAIPLIDKSMRN